MQRALMRLAARGKFYFSVAAAGAFYGAVGLPQSKILKQPLEVIIYRRFDQPSPCAPATGGESTT